ncbi:Cysteine-rich secretory protein family [Phytophthora infestans]|uniref:Cysteine-rich secretory protein family n=1 Tax=Phytophthora infestans TaxID=4787 RepID=A0A8S9UPL5_PHYIN|nr:Cysteine-rich secretory protein family [Phytophthora infestans]
MVSLSTTSLAILLAISATSTGADNLRFESRNLQAKYTSTGQYAASMLASVNAQRAAEGLPALCLNTKLMAASMRHSTDMASKNFMSHTGSDGSTMSMRVTAAGYKWTRVAENVAAGQSSVATVMTAWMNSAGHRANILGDYTMFGTAYAYNSGSTYKHYWTQNFGKGSTESCNYEDVEYEDAPTPTQNTTTDSTDNSTVVLPNEPAPQESKSASESGVCHASIRAHLLSSRPLIRG